MDNLSFSDTPVDSRRRRWRERSVRNLYGARIFFQKFLHKPMERESGLRVGIFFRKFHSPSESQLVCPLYSRLKE